MFMRELAGSRWRSCLRPSICSNFLKQEEIDLENLSFQVRLDEEKYRSQQIQDSDRYVVLVIKRPAAALRYQLSTGEV